MKSSAICKQCGISFEYYSSSQKGLFCSPSCNAKYRGTKHLKKYQFKKGQPSRNKGKKLSLETRKKLSESHIGKKVWNKGLKAKNYPNLANALEKAHESIRGKPSWNKGLTKETDKRVYKYAKNLIGKKGLTNEKNPNWRGNNAGYISIHKWISRKLGKPRKCVECGTTTAKKYEWANINGEYKRDINDYRRLCTSCHAKYDNRGFQCGHKAWNKNFSYTHSASFKKGMIPWNKKLRDSL